MSDTCPSRIIFVLLCSSSLLVGGCSAPPLYQSIANDDESAAVKLIENGARFDSWKGTPPFHLAAYKGHTRAMELMVDRGSNVNESVSTLGTPLHQASMSGNVDTIGWLLDNGADIDSHNHAGETPLYSAAWKGRADAANFLLARGADPNAQSDDGLTPLHAAAEVRHAETLYVLLEHGADVHLKSRGGYTAMNQAFVANGGLDSATLLLAGAGSERNEVKGAPHVNGGVCWALAAYCEQLGERNEAAVLYEAAATWFDAAATTEPETISYYNPNMREGDWLMGSALEQRFGGGYGMTYARTTSIRSSTRSNPMVARYRDYADQCRAKSESLHEPN